MEEAPLTHHSLIVKLRDPTAAEAWREFVALYEPLVYGFARRKGLQDADARDLCQEVFRAVAGAVDKWDPDPARGSFRGWLSRIARNLLLNFLTRKQHEPRGSGSTSVHELLDAQPAAGASVTALFEAEYRRRVFRWAAAEIRDEFAHTTWQAFWRTAVGSQSPRDVAEELGLSVGAVYIARSRVVARLRERIEQLGEGVAEVIEEVNHGNPAESV
jgi:RNA polymerase sigma-70 factor (ECF subfamily)